MNKLFIFLLSASYETNSDVEIQGDLHGDHTGPPDTQIKYTEPLPNR